MVLIINGSNVMVVRPKGIRIWVRINTLPLPSESINSSFPYEKISLMKRHIFYEKTCLMKRPEHTNFVWFIKKFCKNINKTVIECNPKFNNHKFSIISHDNGSDTTCWNFFHINYNYSQDQSCKIIKINKECGNYQKTWLLNWDVWMITEV